MLNGRKIRVIFSITNNRRCTVFVNQSRVTVTCFPPVLRLTFSIEFSLVHYVISVSCDCLNALSSPLKNFSRKCFLQPCRNKILSLFQAFSQLARRKGERGLVRVAPFRPTLFPYFFVRHFRAAPELTKRLEDAGQTSLGVFFKHLSTSPRLHDAGKVFNSS